MFQPTVYKRRWFILFAFCFASMTQAILYNTWSPLLDAVLITYQWSEAFITVLLAVGNVGFILLALPFMYIIERIDLRCGMVLSISLLVMCSAFWNIALHTGQNWLVAMGAVLSGTAGCIPMCFPPLLSAIWFPVAERTKATAIAAMSGYIGVAFSFLTGPYISGINVTTADVEHRDTLAPDFVDNLKVGIQNVVYFDTAFAVASFLMAVIYFPARPPQAPSRSQVEERYDFWQGIKKLYKNRNFWLLSIAFNLPNSLYNSWLGLCSHTFRPLGIDEGTAAWIGFAATVGSYCASILMSAAIDRAKRKMKFVCLLTTILALIQLTLIACIQGRYIRIPEESIKVPLFILCIGVSMCINGVIPLYLELACESAYPVHEGLASTAFILTNGLFSIFYYLLFQIPSLVSDTQWATWSCAGTCALAIPLLVLAKEQYHRLNVDTGADSSD